MYKRDGGYAFLGFLDVKRAHFYSAATRERYIELPAEAKKPGEDVVGKLLKSLYGTRDAPLNWELQIRKVMVALGFKQGKSNPCIYFHASRDLRTVVHGDDFTTAGTFENIKWLHGELSKKWKCVERGILGPPRNTGYNSGHQSPEQNYHLERRWYLVGTRRPSCIVSYCFVVRWTPRRQSHNFTCERSGGGSQGRRRSNVFLER